jgi:poly(3-hydroxybutyrate) depolymerase
MFSAPGSWLAGLPKPRASPPATSWPTASARITRKPEFDLHAVEIDGQQYPVVEKEILRTPFCRLLRFKRYSDVAANIAGLKDDPPVLVVAPLSGHHATLLRDTVRTLLRDHKVYVTDWVDARMVPTAAGAFTLDDYVRRSSASCARSASSTCT